MKKKAVLISIFLILIIVIGFFIQRSRYVDGIRYNSDGTVDIGEGYVAYGLYDENKKIINDAATIPLGESNTFSGFINFQQNNSQRCKYGLILMQNFRQIDFSVNDERTSIYRFELKGKTENWIPIEFEISNDAYELEMLIVNEPDAPNSTLSKEDGSLNWDNMFASQNICVQRFHFGSREQVEWNASKLLPYDFAGLVGFQMVSCDAEYPTVFCSKKAGDKVRVLYGQDVYDAQNVIVVAFCDWKQTQLSEENYNLVFQSVRGENGYIDITLPSCDSEVPYQLFAFIEPYEFGMASQASFRIIIK